MDLIIENTDEISGEVTPNPSKFQTQYATVIGLLADGESIIHSPLIVDDTRELAKAIEDMGGTTKRSKTKWKVWGNGKDIQPASQVTDAKKSIMGLSLLSAVSSLTSRLMISTCKSQLRDLPVPSLLKNLQELGLDIHSVNKDEKPPLVIFQSDIEGGKISFDEAGDPRFLPAPLLLTPFAQEEVEITSYPQKSPRYVDASLKMLKEGGIEVSKENQKITISRGEYEPIEITPSLDMFSTLPYITGAIITNSKIEIKEIKEASNLEELKSLLDDLNIEYESNGEVLTIKKTSNIDSFDIDLEQYPGIIPFLAVLACRAEGETEITNAERARKMKSDRITGIAEGLSKLGANIEEKEDGITVKGPSKLVGDVVNGYHDPALVSALGVAGLTAEGKTQVKNRAETLRQTYPEFVTVFKDLGAEMSYST